MSTGRSLCAAVQLHAWLDGMDDSTRSSHHAMADRSVVACCETCGRGYEFDELRWLAIELGDEVVFECPCGGPVYAVDPEVLTDTEDVAEVDPYDCTACVEAGALCEFHLGFVAGRQSLPSIGLADLVEVPVGLSLDGVEARVSDPTTDGGAG